MAIITISRGTFSGGHALADCVSNKLGYRCLARAALHEVDDRYGIAEEKLTEAMNETPGFLERLSSERSRYLACLRAVLVREVRDDNIVYHGLAGHFLLKDVPNVLRVRVIANMEQRIKGAMERSQLANREEAIQVIKALDDKRIKWTKFLYHVDWHDPSLYDLVINLDNINLDTACGIIYSTINQEQFKRSLDWQKIMDDLVLSTEVKAILATSKGVADTGIEIESNKGTVTITGTVRTLEDADRIREIVRMVPGVKNIDSKMKVSSTW